MSSPPVTDGAAVNALRFVTCLTLLLLAACGGDPSPGEEAPGAPPTSPRPSGESRIELLTFSKLQSHLEATPCLPGSISPLASAARTRQRLLDEGGADVRLICLGDSLRQTSTITTNKAARLGAEHRDEVLLDALATAGVDLYVPSYGDIAGDLLGLLDRCAARELPVVLTNVDVPARDDVLPYMIFEHNGLRVAALATIPPDAPKGKADLEQQGVRVVKPVRRVREVSEGLLERGEADIIAVFSAMPNRINYRLCDLPSVHFIIGTTDRGMAAGRVVHRHDSWMMNQEFNGQELGRTTFRVVDGNLSLADLSGLYYLPEQLAAEEAALDLYEQEFGTRDLTQLASILSPGREQAFLDKYLLLDETKQWLVDYADYPGSYVAHRVEPFDGPVMDDPVRAVLDRQAGAIQAAVAQVRKEPEPVDPFSPIPRPESCQECHADQFEHWQGTGHARTYELLVEVGRQNDTSCLVCHAAGYARPVGFLDPRLEAPFGGYTCWNCHGTESYHAELLRGATDPAFIGIREAEPMLTFCENCHSPDRSPDFDAEEALARVGCPPMRQDDPTLALVRSRVLTAIERQRENGTAEPRDLYREGRALVGLGRLEEGLEAIEQFLSELSPNSDAYVPQHLEAAEFLDDLNRSAAGIEMLRRLLGVRPGDPNLHLAYVGLLLDAKDENARDPGWAATHLDLVAPIVEGERMEPEELDIRLLQVRALFESGRQQEGYQLLQMLNGNFARNERIQELLARYLSPR